MSFMQGIFLRRRTRVEATLSPDVYDLRAINERVHDALFRLGKTRMELAEALGMDASIPAASQPDAIPPASMQTMVRVARFLGVSLRWLLHGVADNEIDRFVCTASPGPGITGGGIGDVDGGSVLQGVTAKNITVQNFAGADGLSRTEAEILILLRGLSPQKKMQAIDAILAIAEQ